MGLHSFAGAIQWGQPLTISNDFKTVSIGLILSQTLDDLGTHKKLLSMESPQITFRCSLEVKDFQQLVDKWKSALNLSNSAILKKCAASFIYGAYKFTPPRPAMGRTTIPKNLYVRHVEPLQTVIDGGNATKSDRDAYHKKMKYKIFVRAEGALTKGRSAYAYAKTASEAKQLSKIANRGLARWSWGSDADSEVRPKTLDRLPQRAPNLRRYNFNKISYVFNNDAESCVYITNSSTNAELFLRFAANKGLDNANRTMKKCLQATAMCLRDLHQQIHQQASSVVKNNLDKLFEIK